MNREKEMFRERLESQMEEYLNQGGEIERIPAGVSGDLKFKEYGHGNKTQRNWRSDKPTNTFNRDGFIKSL